MKSIDQIKNDYHQFIDIQMGKYFKTANKESFDNDEEAKLVLDEIVKTYNAEVASEHLKLDNLNSIAINSWFNQIDIDFGKIINQMKEFEEVFEQELDQVFNEFDRIFYYLPEGSMQVVIFSGPALDAFGLPIERFQNLSKGETATEFEKDLITWAFELTLSVMDAFFTRSRHKRQNELENAVSIGIEYLDRDLSKKVVQEIFKNISETLGGKPNKNSPSTNRKKKNKP